MYVRAKFPCFNLGVQDMYYLFPNYSRAKDKWTQLIYIGRSSLFLTGKTIQTLLSSSIHQVSAYCMHMSGQEEKEMEEMM